MVLPFLTALNTKLKMKSISDLITVMQTTLNVQDPEAMHACMVHCTAQYYTSNNYYNAVRFCIVYSRLKNCF